ncbi:beta-galactosidase [Nesterenkonia halotolerans]|uniref:Beta-galactosidase n=1 Tax=Nesterenkonia halotolerans TaxID=225325 RepID=A0ABR9J7S5_9MICC|nr:beta-galactosidase [Nesterenkonia halotolerans]MBE1515049.1 beta-galactosidase [Nesterenkonia halotolerans]
MTTPKNTSDAPSAAQGPHPLEWPSSVPGLAYGGDYNPEQWPESTRAEDVELMGAAGVNLVSVGIFSWAMLEPREGEYDWEWLDETMDRLHASGVRVALATATASPPPWLTHQHPQILPETAEGVTLWPGARQAYSVSNPVFREYALRMTWAVAQRYATHPALALWHVDNELGCHNSHDFSEDAAAAFRTWLTARYGTVEQLNKAWGTAFWSQRYSSFEEVLPPRTAPMFVNPTQQLDFHRYSSDELLDYFREMKAILRELTPGVPVTTNFMCTTRSKNMDYFSWAAEMDVIATDHYTVADDPHRHIELAFSADLTRGVAQGKPWMLMEHSTSAVNWQPRNHTKGPAEMLRDSLSHVAHGADAVMFFQWRQSRAGAEKYHSAMVPHAGTDSDVWRTSVSLGEALRRLAPVKGSRVEAEVAVLFDYAAWWGAELDSHPVNDLSYPQEVLHWYRGLWESGVSVDVVHPSADLSRYRAIIVPTLYLVTDADASNVAAAAEAGASVLITCFSGIVDEHDAVRLGGYPGAFRELLGIRTEEFWPLQAQEQVHLDDGTRGSLWSEKIHLHDDGAGAAQALRRFASLRLTGEVGPGGVPEAVAPTAAPTGEFALSGWPAVTRREVGEGAAWYVGTRPDDAGVRALTAELLIEAGVSPVHEDAPEGVEVIRRSAASGEEPKSFLFALNHTSTDVRLRVRGLEVLSGQKVRGKLTVPAGGVAVVHEA